jgi:superfamily II DNA/RNA helicase
VRAEHIDGSTPKEERDATLARLASGEIEVVVNCFVLTEGFDCPEIGCIILARPTRKMGLYRQMIGRALRPADGKSDAIIIDHSGAVFRHGFAEDRIDWTLDPDKRAESPRNIARQEFASFRLIECTNCGAIRTAGEACQHCGFLPQRKPQNILVADGELGWSTVTARQRSTLRTLKRESDGIPNSPSLPRSADINRDGFRISIKRNSVAGRLGVPSQSPEYHQQKLDPGFARAKLHMQGRRDEETVRPRKAGSSAAAAI